MEYPKINSLWKRQGWYFDEKAKKDSSKQPGRQSFIVGDYACPEFESITRWEVDEKIDGTNVRIYWDPEDQFSPCFCGRTKDAQMPTFLLRYLQETFHREKLAQCFPKARKVVLYGEGYGPKIQAVGSRYRNDVGFILFDVFIDGWWLQKSSVNDLGDQLGIPHTLNQQILTTPEVIEFVKSKPYSHVSVDPTLVIEGVIARAYPLMLFRQHQTPIMFKLKVRDFPEINTCTDKEAA